MIDIFDMQLIRWINKLAHKILTLPQFDGNALKTDYL